ncbi:hypothetical protein T07_14353 [Trichinella nelsoni]|uniref:Uncharacterized protein n=1 Tax=Trichinella nelsoni TaxID=6336 RepID=A0A0V0RC69_9BILA|nr:hypothetical protein T07_14353 [Trichinella nelsoni]
MSLVPGSLIAYFSRYSSKKCQIFVNAISLTEYATEIRNNQNNNM